MLAEVTSPLKGEWMSPRRRFTSAMYRGNVDKVPACTLSSVVTVEMMDLVDAPFPEAHLDAEKMARLAATAHDVFGMDTIMPVFHSQLESDALGGETEWAEKDNWPSPSRFTITEPEQVKMPGRLPAAADDGRRDRGHQAAPAPLSGCRHRRQGLWAVVGRLPDGRHRGLPHGRHARSRQDQALPRRVPAGLPGLGAGPVRGRGRRRDVGGPHDRRPVPGRDVPRLPAGDAPAHHLRDGRPRHLPLLRQDHRPGPPLRRGRLGRLPFRIAGRRARGARDGRRADGPDGQPQQSVPALAGHARGRLQGVLGPHGRRRRWARPGRAPCRS